MAYRMYRVAGLDQHADDGEFLGDYRSFDAALAARDNDVIAQLYRGGGMYMEVTHLIVGPGVLGRRTAHPVITAIGGDAAGQIGIDAQIAAARSWLASVRRAERETGNA